MSLRLDELVDLVLPASCVACGAAGRRWCDGCRPAARPGWVPGRPGTAAAVDYAGPVRDAMLGYKERGQRSLAIPLAALLTQAVRLVGEGAQPAGRGGTGAPPQLVLVPVPSRRAVARSRGGDHVLRLARAAARDLPGVSVWQLLTLRGRPRDSAGLNVAERAANVAGRMSARPWGASTSGERRTSRPEGVGSEQLIVVDDIVTTGATLGEAERALRDEGWPVLGAAVVAATRSRRLVAAERRGAGRASRRAQSVVVHSESPV